MLGIMLKCFSINHQVYPSYHKIYYLFLFFQVRGVMHRSFYHTCGGKVLFKSVKFMYSFSISYLVLFTRRGKERILYDSGLTSIKSIYNGTSSITWKNGLVNLMLIAIDRCQGNNGTLPYSDPCICFKFEKESSFSTKQYIKDCVRYFLSNFCFSTK